MADDELVVRAKTDRVAFGLLYDRYYPVSIRYGMRRLLDRTLAEDIVSDVFLTVASKLPAFAGQTETEFRCWLFRIATNAVVAHLRQSRRRQELLRAAVRRRPRAERRLPTARGPPWKRSNGPSFTRPCQLGEREQTILTLRFFADCSHEEIAEIVDATPGAVRTASRTLSHLRERFNPLSSTDEVGRSQSMGTGIWVASRPPFFPSAVPKD